MRYGRFGGPISVWVSNYVCVAISKWFINNLKFAAIG